jgi:hypothetical protein
MSQIYEHPNTEIGIEAQYQCLGYLALEPIQCQALQCLHQKCKNRDVGGGVLFETVVGADLGAFRAVFAFAAARADEPP